MAVWRARASHPATMQRVRMLAATVVQSCEHLLALNALPAVVPVEADSRFVREPLDEQLGSGAAGVAVPGAERRHPRWTDSVGAGWCRVVAQERQGDVPVEAGEQLRRRRVVDLRYRPHADRARRPSYQLGSLGFSSRHIRSDGSRQACGAISWWIAFGPQLPGAYGLTGGGAPAAGSISPRGSRCRPPW